MRLPCFCWQVSRRLKRWLHAPFLRFCLDDSPFLLAPFYFSIRCSLFRSWPPHLPSRQCLGPGRARLISLLSFAIARIAAETRQCLQCLVALLCWFLQRFEGGQPPRRAGRPDQALRLRQLQHATQGPYLPEGSWIGVCHTPFGDRVRGWVGRIDGCHPPCHGSLDVLSIFITLSALVCMCVRGCDSLLQFVCERLFLSFFFLTN